jgi:DNA-directed RNA polymerase I, II, and III subunit RPABC5
MIIPIRCYTCNKVIGNKWETYVKYIEENGYSNNDAFIKLGLIRYCCRRMFLSHIEILEKILNYPKDYSP